jgi:magnesium-transporting ATPase (P-type)
VIVVEASLGDEDKNVEEPTITFTLTDDSLESNQGLRYSSSENDEIDAELGRLLPHNYHFAMTGNTWGVIRSHFHHLLPKLIQRGSVFARMAPEQKAQLVEEYQAIDYVSTKFHNRYFKLLPLL